MRGLRPSRGVHDAPALPPCRALPAVLRHNLAEQRTVCKVWDGEPHLPARSSSVNRLVTVRGDFRRAINLLVIAPPRIAVKAWYRGGQSYQKNGRARITATVSAISLRKWANKKSD